MYRPTYKPIGVGGTDGPCLDLYLPPFSGPQETFFLLKIELFFMMGLKSSLSDRNLYLYPGTPPQFIFIHTSYTS